VRSDVIRLVEGHTTDPRPIVRCPVGVHATVDARTPVEGETAVDLNARRPSSINGCVRGN
jgi:hypothetical protein